MMKVTSQKDLQQEVVDKEKTMAGSFFARTKGCFIKKLKAQKSPEEIWKRELFATFKAAKQDPSPINLNAVALMLEAKRHLSI